MKKLLLVTIIAFISVSIVGCGGNNTNSAVDEFPSSVKNGKVIATYSSKEIKEGLVKDGYISKDQIVFGLKVYKINYVTKLANKEINASAIIAVPTRDGVDSDQNSRLEMMHDFGFATVVDFHGTIFKNNDSPSVSAAKGYKNIAVPIIYSALNGYITLQCDYIGFGDSKNVFHPYLLQKPQGKNGVDAIKAYIDFSNANKFNISKKLFISGYSEGGYVAMATIAKAQENGIKITASTPMAGPYILHYTAKEALKLKRISSPSFLAAVAHSYTKYYKKDINKIINSPYSKKLDKLLDSKEYSRVEIDANLTNKVSGDDGLFKKDFVDNFSNSWFYDKLKINSVVDFKPKSDINFIHCKGDNVIPYEISEATKIYLEQYYNPDVFLQLSKVEKELGLKKSLSHSECALYAYYLSAKYFNKYRLEELGY